MKLIIFIVFNLASPAILQAVDAVDEPQEILSTAIAVWQMGDVSDSAGRDSALTIHEPVQLGTALADPDHTASLVRGGDGRAALLDGGWLDAGQGADGECNLTGDKFTALIRMRCAAAGLWTTRGFFTKGGGHDRLVFNFFSHDFEQGSEGMRIGCEIGVEGRAGLGGQVMVPVAQIGATEWHDVMVRYDGRELVLFIDGVALNRQPATGRLRQGNTEPLGIGEGGAGDNPFPCLIDHAALWSRPLSDDEIVALSGGSTVVAQKQAAFAKYIPPPRQPSTLDLVNQSRSLTHKFQSDAHRPRYHFMHMEDGDIMPGDPNGAIWWKGRYHLFYIFQRHQAVEPRVVHCWGHASSIDMVHWEHHPTALDVAPDDPDRGIFSGNAFVTKEGIPLILYHGVNTGNCIATAQDDRLIRWQKSPTNPIVRMPKQGEPDFGKYDSWDPHGWLEGDTYYAIFGGNPGTGTQPALFKGASMTQLQYVSGFLDNDRWSQAGEDVSCPDFFRIGNRHMLLCISHMRGARYFLGRWENEHFIAESHARMNWPGGAFFAPETLLDDKGRRIVWAWCMDERPQSARIASGWSGVMSLPRNLTLDTDGSLQIEPVDELKQLRFNHRSHQNLTVNPNADLVLNDIQGDSLELAIEMQVVDGSECGVRVRCTPDGAEQTAISFNSQTGILRIDLEKSTLDPSVRYRSWCLFKPEDPEDANQRVLSQEAPFVLQPGEPLRLRIFLDRSMLEVFANDRQCLTQRLWPTRSDASGVSLFSHGGTTIAKSVDAWEMAASQPD